MNCVTQQGEIRAWWYDHDSNFGDMVTPYLLHGLTNRNVLFEPRETSNTKCLVVGSILHLGDNTACEVWGSGVIAPDAVISPPARIHAVRGPLSRAHLLAAGIACPDVYGDPAVLLPLVYHPEISAEYDWGIIPHYVDAETPWVADMRTKKGVLVIDVLQPLEKVISDILRCRHIASSSLHGIIAADAYGKPNTWIVLSDQVIGNGFKFRDYQLSLGPEKAPLVISSDHGITDLAAHATLRDTAALVPALLKACPFDLSIATPFNG